ncbi:BnaCnng50160D [Brassica napus]|uniref:BnaCnng50160D protein n=1 Tax=Brassica napus TaxID=3708 RepID=A0A078JKE2_BRANA|nr:BnaCnng50160D [Brassica napus]
MGCTSKWSKLEHTSKCSTMEYATISSTMEHSTKFSSWSATIKCSANQLFWNNTNKSSLRIYSWKSRWKSTEYSTKLFGRCKYRFFTKGPPITIN